MLKFWLRIRKAYSISKDAFLKEILSLNEEEMNILYELSKKTLYKNFISEIIAEYPELKEYLHNETDLLCMYDLYDYLSWKLGKEEPPPEYKKVILEFRKAVKHRKFPE